MKLPALRAAAAAVALVLGIGTAVAGPSTTAHAIDTTKGSAGYCPDDDGVTVVIDFQELGGSTIIRCAPGDQDTGLDALKNAGIQITGTNRWGEAFICRIEGKPGTDTEPCIDTPPATAYWSYWYASNGGSWTYSQWGVMNRTPPPGSFEGWSFSLNRTETSNPPPGVVPTRPSDEDTDSPADSEPADSGPADTGGTEQASGDADPAPSDRTDTADDDVSSGDAVPAPEEPTPGPQDTPVEAADWTGGEELHNTAAQTDTGMPMGTLAALIAVGALAAAGGTTAWRRRQRADRSA